MDLQIELVDGRPLRHQLAEGLRDAIDSGRLAPGDRLPSSRDLARSLDISRGVVVQTYVQLASDGYVVARRGSVTRVADRRARVGAPPVGVAATYRFDLRPGQPDLHAFPRRRWQTALVEAGRAWPDRRLTYAPHEGIPELRNALAEYLSRSRAVVADPRSVVVCCGVSQALVAIWVALRRRGVREIAIEDPGWRWQVRTAQYAGVKPIPIAVDEQGLDVDALSRTDAGAVVVTPAHQYPTGVVMSPERRESLLRWARDRDGLIVEDDYDSEFRLDGAPIASLQGLDSEYVAFVGTTSKTLAPALRIGWTVVPARLAADVVNSLKVTAAVPPILDQAALASFIEGGALDRHLRQMRRRYRAKRDHLCDELAVQLPEVRIGGTAAGIHLTAWLPDHWDESGIAGRARDAGVATHELHRHCTTSATFPPALLLGYALPSAAEVSAGVDLLAEACRATPPARLS